MFTGAMLTLGMHPVPEIEAALANAFNQWMVERILPEEDRVRAFLYLPFNDPKAAEATVERYLGAKGVAGFLVSSMRHKPVHANEYMRLYRMLEESGQVLAFHAANTWQDQYTGQLNKFLSMHAISFTLCNMVHITNWVVNGMPERFPKLKVIWVESGLAWVPFMMQRLDHEYMMRSSEAPLLKGLPSDYMRQMYYTSQPMEHTSDEMLEMTFKAINAKTQLLYASDWPHWDFDLPAKVVDLPFLDDEARRNILGLNAARIFGLEVPERYRLAAQRQAAE
jgi:predicted TIM-barrel fold metal-dependent hydrolase